MMLMAGSNSDIEAADATATLQQQIEEQVAISTELSERLERLQLSIEGQELIEPENPSSIDDDSSNAQIHPDYQATLDEILENSTVYKRAMYRSNNAASSSSVVSRSWSIISGISMTQISVLAVLNLPLYDTEIERFRQLTNAPEDRNSFSSRKSIGAHSSALRRLNKELAAMERNPPKGFACGPIGDDMVSAC
jgi:hypothetical protein